MQWSTLASRPPRKLQLAFADHPHLACRGREGLWADVGGNSRQGESEEKSLITITQFLS